MDLPCCYVYGIPHIQYISVPEVRVASYVRLPEYGRHAIPVGATEVSAIPVSSGEMAAHLYIGIP